MPSPVITPNMSLTAPAIGSTVSPTWAQYVNNDFSILDSHDHSPGSGVPITPAGINITADLSFMGNNAVDLRTTRYTPISLGSLTGSDVGCILVSGVDMYFVDGSGNQIRMTASGSIAGATGSISGLVSPASAVYVPGSKTFFWSSDSGVPANMDFGSAVLRYSSTLGYPTPSGTNWISLEVPSSISSGYALTLPAAPPVSQQLLQMDSSGNVLTSNTVPNLTIGSAVLTPSGMTSNLNISNGIQFGGEAFLATFGDDRTLSVTNQAGTSSRAVVVSANPNTHGLMIVRASIAASTVTVAGEGFSCSRFATGRYTVTFTTPFADAPAVAVTVTGNGGVNTFGWDFTATPTSTGFEVEIYNNVSGFVNTDFCFIAIGQRG